MEGEWLAGARERARAIVRCGFNEIREKISDQIRFTDADVETEIQARLVRQIAHFLVDSVRGADREGIYLLAGQLECLMLRKSGGAPEQWGAKEWQRFRETVAAFTRRLTEMMPQAHGA
ncbi:MAG TPA: hypothetical protein VK914_07710 [bacterium]|nr:hypothetical protein [bacterium]